MELLTETLRAGDTNPLATAFASWPKPRQLFETYERRVAEGALDAVITLDDDPGLMFTKRLR